MSEPTTPTGKRLWSYRGGLMREDILAIEAEAREQERKRWLPNMKHRHRRDVILRPRLVHHFEIEHGLGEVCPLGICVLVEPTP